MAVHLGAYSTWLSYPKQLPRTGNGISSLPGRLQV